MDSTLMGSRPQLVEFAFALKSLARHKLAVVVVTLSVAEDRASDLMELSDFWFDLVGAAKMSQKSSSSHHGVLTVSKLPNLKTLKCPVASSYGRYHFKSTKSKFSLEKIHLPPAEFEQADSSSAASKPSLHAIGNDW